MVPAGPAARIAAVVAAIIGRRTAGRLRCTAGRLRFTTTGFATAAVMAAVPAESQELEGVGVGRRTEEDQRAGCQHRISNSTSHGEGSLHKVNNSGESTRAREPPATATPCDPVGGPRGRKTSSAPQALPGKAAPSRPLTHATADNFASKRRRLGTSERVRRSLLPARISWCQEAASARPTHRSLESALFQPSTAIVLLFFAASASSAFFPYHAVVGAG